MNNDLLLVKLSSVIAIALCYMGYKKNGKNMLISGKIIAMETRTVIKKVNITGPYLNGKIKNQLQSFRLGFFFISHST